MNFDSIHVCLAKAKSPLSPIAAGSGQKGSMSKVPSKHIPVCQHYMPT